MNSGFEEIEAKAKAGPIAVTGPLKLWELHGKLYCDGLFKMHDQEGFSLADSLIQCRNRGWIPCLEQCACDAIAAGWSPHKARQMIADAIRDAKVIA